MPLSLRPPQYPDGIQPLILQPSLTGQAGAWWKEGKSPFESPAEGTTSCIPRFCVDLQTFAAYHVGNSPSLTMSCFYPARVIPHRLEWEAVGPVRRHFSPVSCLPAGRKWNHTMKQTLLFVALAFALTVALPARAQGGCTDSPENPTLILAGLAGGAFAVSSIKTRIQARRASKNQ